ncbi:aspartate kinase [Kyrpidia spormannii]|uniref:Aspartokinase n=1 Tax=Kyrpidia spormannii TaxID=2055160 RepID=A0A2K8N6P7_9BACL|nr:MULTISPECIES: aspartate kinase [Kyrpidia]ATY84973.1 aspartate kinase [Kyrpidia spormannii]MCL6574703.1 aspartate kinase [Kyrpidia sp.]
MRILVQKFGGTSLAGDEPRQWAVHHVEKALAQEFRVVVVVSAMGRQGAPYATDTLLGLIPPGASTPREMDLLLSCGEIISAVSFAALLRTHKIRATALTGGQAGIVTESEFGAAPILEVKPGRILRELEQGNVVVVAGFQGRTADGEITTLGRGGSDTTAAALGVALDAERVDIFTDVEGIMTADPRIVRDARRLPQATYTEICNLAYQGAKVIHPRAVEIAMRKNIPVRVRATMSDDEGTLVTNVEDDGRLEGRDPGDRLVTGITQTSRIVQIKIAQPSGAPPVHRAVFQAMADAGISVDFINVGPGGVAFTVSEAEAGRAEQILRHLGVEPEIVPGCAKVSVVGAGIAGVPGVMARVVGALAEEGVEILQSADSHTTIWCLVREEDMNRAVCALHRRFGLDGILR